MMPLNELSTCVVDLSVETTVRLTGVTLRHTGDSCCGVDIVLLYYGVLDCTLIRILDTVTSTRLMDDSDNLLVVGQSTARTAYANSPLLELLLALERTIGLYTDSTTDELLSIQLGTDEETSDYRLQLRCLQESLVKLYKVETPHHFFNTPTRHALLQTFDKFLVCLGMLLRHSTSY